MVLRDTGTKTLRTGSSSLIFNSSDQGSDVSGSHTHRRSNSSSFLHPEVPAELNQVDPQEHVRSFRSRTQSRFSDADVSQREGRGYVSLIVQSKSIRDQKKVPEMLVYFCHYAGMLSVLLRSASPCMTNAYHTVEVQGRTFYQIFPLRTSQVKSKQTEKSTLKLFEVHEN